jgi:hypothetical protein
LALHMSFVVGATLTRTAVPAGHAKLRYR